MSASVSAILSGVGVYTPDNVVSNSDLEKIVDTSDSWITDRTGIKQRHILPESSDWKASDMGVEAALKALSAANIAPENLDGIIAAGLNPDKPWPAIACFIQQKLKAKGFAFDVTAACAGFVYAVNMASLLIRSGQCKNILVVGAELISRIVDWKDRNTCILFGDAAGAVVLSHSEDQNRGVFHSVLESDGSATDILFLDSALDLADGQAHPTIKMNGKQVFKKAVQSLTDVVQRCLSDQGLSIEEVKFAFFHQANYRILEAVAEKLKLPRDKIIMNLSQYGNTSSASIPLALQEALDHKQLKQGDLVLFAAIGGGMSWGCNLLRW